MITVEHSKGIYIVTEIMHSFTYTKITHWYYDLTRNLISEDINFPSSMKTREMIQEQRDWFNTYYLPKAKNI